MNNGLWPALLQVQGELGAIARDSHATAGATYSYASLGAVLAAVRPALGRAGLVLTQDTTARPEIGLVEVTTHIVHAASGERVTATVAAAPASPTRRDGTAVLAEPQQVGVAISYARRYGLLCILGLATEDSDGAASSRHQRHTPAAPETPADVLAPRKAAFQALAARVTRPEVERRLGVVAATGSDPDATPEMDRLAPVRERLGAAMGGNPAAWRKLTDGEFAELVNALDKWPEGL